ncbi:MAG: MarR family transcriptional regulator [Firmicutes bacterium]|nr:MarR family transcriptional regulator [Bacillota bacterium]
MRSIAEPGGCGRNAGEAIGMTDRIEQLAEEFDEVLPELVRSALHVVSDLGKASGITATQSLVLRHLYQQGPRSATQIGELLGVTSGPVTSLTRRLVVLRLVQREPDDRDRRIVHFSLTAEGLRVAQDMMIARRGAWQRMFSDIGAELSEPGVGFAQAATRWLQRESADIARKGAGKA